MLSGNMRYTHFPYCLLRQPDGRYVLLNRNYKPVGFMTGKWMNYEDAPVAVRIKGLGPKTAARLDHKGRDDIERMHFYGDGCIPTNAPEHMAAYFKRLELLMTLKVDAEID